MGTIKRAVVLLQKKFESENRSLFLDEYGFLRNMLYVLQPQRAFDPDFVSKIAMEMITKWHRASPTEKEEVSSHILLERIAQIMDEVFSKFQAPKRKSPLCPRTPDDTQIFLKKGVHLICVGAEKEVYPQILGVYGFVGSLPDRRNLLLCRTSTTWDEVQLMLLRWWQRNRVMVGACCSGEEESVEDNVDLFCLANADVLSLETQVHLVEFINKVPSTEQHHPLVFVCGPSKSSHIVFQFSNRFVVGFDFCKFEILSNRFFIEKHKLFKAPMGSLSSINIMMKMFFRHIPQEQLEQENLFQFGLQFVNGNNTRTFQRQASLNL